jgi:hypothetical protein
LIALSGILMRNTLIVIRHIKTGRGPNLVLLHTLRTQLDIFEKLMPLLAERFTVYALDYPAAP